MNISLLDNTISGAVAVSINKLSIENVNFLTKTVNINQTTINRSGLLLQSKIFIDNIPSPTLQIRLV
jgi:hypothetical protein